MPPKLTATWRERLTDHAQRAVADYSRWRADLRDDPTLVWRTRPIIFAITGIVLIGIAFGIQALANHWVAAASGSRVFEKPTPTATVYVACANPNCLDAAVLQLPMNFRAWPLPCATCGGASVHRAELCKSCRTWYAASQGPCPHCTAKAAPPKTLTPRKPSKPGDSEDGWGPLPDSAP
ncbi:MAG: hypothetical protein CHACPFDD_02586 [Phycisphaerae bacterium]|nr:hypothetical protein [Phycisphaerae bacterium]